MESATAAVPVIPSMLRDELWHPAITHFPIAFLALAGVLAFVWMFSKRGGPTLLLVLTLGVVGGWLAILTGGWAEDVVNRVICDPSVTHEHEKWAEWSVWVATATLPFVAFAVARRKKNPSGKFRFLIAIALAFVLGSILYAGHLGASLTYQQAAGVYKPTLQCTEFE